MAEQSVRLTRDEVEAWATEEEDDAKWVPMPAVVLIAQTALAALDEVERLMHIVSDAALFVEVTEDRLDCCEWSEEMCAGDCPVVVRENLAAGIWPEEAPRG